MAPMILCLALSCWAQINGRDELEIPVKAKFDGECTKILHEGGLKTFLFDVDCILGTFFFVVRGDGVSEGRTGEMHKQGS